MSFEGAEALLASWRRGLAPDPALTVSQWADQHRVLTTRGAGEPGRYRTSRTPYLRAVMDALSASHPAEKVVFMKSAQVGATEAGVNWMGYVVHHVPGPFLLVEGSLDVVKAVVQQKIDPLIEATPAVRALIPPARSRDSGNTATMKRFPGGYLRMVGANTPTSLRAMPARWVFLDEVDAYPGDVGGEGDPVALAKGRTISFGHRAKMLLASTPTVMGSSRIEREWEATDQQRYHVACPHCGAFQWLKFERLRWEKGQPQTAAYQCEHCDEFIEERHKTAMMDEANGAHWAPTAPPDQVAAAKAARVVGFHISALYSPIGWMSWEAIARQYDAAMGDDAQIKTFKNTVLGELWVERGDAPDWQRLYERREEFEAPVPAGAVMLTAGVDIQQDRIEAYVWGWGRGLESWLVDRLVTGKGPDTEEGWAELEAFLSRSWRHEGGADIAIARACIDTGYNASTVYAWVRKQDQGRVVAIKGEEGFAKASPVTGPTYVDVNLQGKRVRRGARLWHVAVSMLKSETYKFFRLERPTDEELEDGAVYPAGTIHLPTWADSEVIKQLTAEQLIAKKNRRGYARMEWTKTRERNEALDCRVYARAGVHMLGLDRWTPEQWTEAQDRLAPAPAQPAPADRAEARGNANGWLPRSGRKWI